MTGFSSNNIFFPAAKEPADLNTGGYSSHIICLPDPSNENTNIDTNFRDDSGIVVFVGDQEFQLGEMGIIRDNPTGPYSGSGEIVVDGPFNGWGNNRDGWTICSNCAVDTCDPDNVDCACKTGEDCDGTKPLCTCINDCVSNNLGGYCDSVCKKSTTVQECGKDNPS